MIVRGGVLEDGARRRSMRSQRYLEGCSRSQCRGSSPVLDMRQLRILWRMSVCLFTGPVYVQLIPEATGNAWQKAPSLVNRVLRSVFTTEAGSTNFEKVVLSGEKVRRCGSTRQLRRILTCSSLARSWRWFVTPTRVCLTSVAGPISTGVLRV